MSLLENNNWFRVKKGTKEEMNKEADKLQEIVDNAVNTQQQLHKLNEDKFSASQVPDDQELNIAGRAHYLGGEMEINKELANEAEKDIRIPAPETDSNYSNPN